MEPAKLFCSLDVANMHRVDINATPVFVEHTCPLGKT